MRKTKSIDVPTENLYLIDIPTAARRLSTTVFAVREIIRSGKLKYVRIGHKMLISPSAIQDYIAQSEIYYERPRISAMPDAAAAA